MRDFTQLRRLARFEYGEALSAERRRDGAVPVMSSGGVSGSHDAANAPGPTVVVGRKGSHGSVWWSHDAPFVIDTAFFVLPNPGVADLRWLYYALGSLNLRGASIDVGVPGLSREAAYEQMVPVLSVVEQRRIANFLDERVARIDQIIAARRKQILALQASTARAAYEVITGAATADRRPSGLPWVETLPSHWPVLTVGSQFRVDLGKMLNESRQTGDDSVLYLRNTNVQWDRVTTDDLKAMDIAADELERYTVQAGDLLICEGGQPGRAAIWEGGVSPLGFQKALHRARTRGRSHPGWLLECLRVAVALNVFAIENEQTTIGHLTNEQLRATRFPFPDSSVQKVGVDRLRSIRSASRRSGVGLERSIELLQEYKQSLITAAVTGELDVTTASTTIPGE